MEVLKDSFHFNIGNFKCLVISDGTFKVPKVQPQKSLSHNAQPKLILESTCMFVRTEDHKVLIDTGYGIGVESNAGKLFQNLQAEGIQFTEIDTVILSHCHSDHIGGNTDIHGKPAFPNAHYVIYKKEWEFWMSDYNFTQLDSESRKFLAIVPQRLKPIKDQVTLVDGEVEIVPGIKVIQAPGHTPGHIVLLISSGSEQLLHTCDLFHDPLDLEQPNRELVSDNIPKQAIYTRIQILSQFATPGTLVFACHFTFPGLGHIEQKGDIFLWHPIKIKDKI